MDKKKFQHFYQKINVYCDNRGRTIKIKRQEIVMGIINLNSSFIAYGNAVGEKEHEGPLSDRFDMHDKTDRFGQKTWEEAEGEMLRLSLNIALNKCGLTFEDIDALFAGDLLNQCTSSAYGFLGCNIPYFGIYGACSTSAEGIMLASVMTTNNVYNICAAATSSHNCAAERQYRTPIEYGGQRSPTAQWTVTGAGSFIIGGSGEGKVKIALGMPGRVIDGGVRDASNMGAAMAPAVADTCVRFFRESNTNPADYDLVLTGDLGHEGGKIFRELMKMDGYCVDGVYNDCGMIIFDKNTQDTHAGGSGCGCAASVLSAYILPEMEKGRLKNILFVASGAMMSPDSLKQGRSIPAIGHLLNFKV
ncbi:MAG: stage V sporulation protein AD [Ruminococcaceae bacterium]|nr:stage V sporulation protein AD [Oscillospiraceae bacterium]